MVLVGCSHKTGRVTVIKTMISSTVVTAVGRRILPAINILSRVCQCGQSRFQFSSSTSSHAKEAKKVIYSVEEPSRSRPQTMFDKLKTLKQQEKQSLTEPARDEEPDLSDIQLLLELRLQKEREKVVKTPFPNLVQNVEKREWTPGSKRVGAIGVKLGMSCLWLKNGSRIGVTLVQIKECEVIRARISHEDGGNTAVTDLLVGAVNMKDDELHKVSKKQYGGFVSHNVPVKKKTAAFKVGVNGLLQPGTPIYAAHFTAGQYVKVKGRSKDRGFQGVMKRWGMKGQPASHGQTKTHRRLGAIGGGGVSHWMGLRYFPGLKQKLVQTSNSIQSYHTMNQALIDALDLSPGRIWPGKKMPGHMGNNSVTRVRLKVWRINTRLNVLYIHGDLPGDRGDFVTIQDSACEKHENGAPPFPTYFPDTDNPLEEDIFDSEVHQPEDESLQFEAVK